MQSLGTGLADSGIEPKRPILAGWTRASQEDDRKEVWIHAETTMMAVSQACATPYELTLSVLGRRCNALLVLVALAAFAMLDATEDPTLRGDHRRIFRLAIKP